MRIRRIGLRNYRGVVERDVTLLPAGSETGVTVVEGANEVGKTSLADAIWHALDFQDSSKAKEIAALKPVDRDVGTEITLELECGPYAFTYLKRFNKDRETRLAITAPRAETLTGREAHERVRSMLDESIDVPLWEALRVRQGTALSQAEVSETRGLARALESEAGATAIGEREADLYERVATEFRAYFTQTGQDGKELKAARKAREQAEETLQEVEGQLAALEEDIERIDRLERELPTLRGRVVQCERTAEEQTAELTRVARLEQDVQACAHAVEAADATAEAARERHDARLRLLAEVEEAQADLAELRQQVDDDQRHLASAVDAHASAQMRLEEARVAAKAADEVAVLCQEDLDHLREANELADLHARQERVAASSEQILELQERCDANRVDQAVLERLRPLHLEVEKTAAALSAGSPRVRLDTDADVTLEIDGADVAVAAGERVEHTVASRWSAVLPGLGTVAVEAGQGAETLAREHSATRRALSEALAEAGVSDLSEAERAAEERRDAEAALAGARGVRDHALDGASSNEIDERIALLERRTADYETTRTSELRLPATAEDAATSLEEAKEAASLAARALAVAVGEEQAARERVQGLRDEGQDRLVRREVVTDTVTRLSERLARERQVTTDEDLLEAWEEAGYARTAAYDRLAEARKRLRDADPEAVRALADNAVASAEDARRRLREADDDLRDLRARVEVRGGEGLFDERARAQAALDAAEAHDRRLRRRAEAARTLKETFDAHRDASRRRYVGPLTEQIVKLGRLVNAGAVFDVELDEDLRIHKRVLDGVPLDFDALSAGAQEQLSLIGRVACATLVADNGGAPLIIDDSLGYSDADRLEAMGAVLRIAGQHCQIIVLTCYPDRYRHVGGATTVSLT